MTLHLFHKTASKHKAKIDRTLDAGRKLQTVFTMGDFNMLLSVISVINKTTDLNIEPYIQKLANRYSSQVHRNIYKNCTFSRPQRFQQPSKNGCHIDNMFPTTMQLC